MSTSANTSEVLPCTLHLKNDQNFNTTSGQPEKNPVSALNTTDSSLNISSTVELTGKNNPSLPVEVSNKLSFRGRAGLRPLLDLHKDHDMESLPSPTREAPTSFPSFLRTKSVADELSSSKPVSLKIDSVESRMHPYETDVVKAVSSYQKRFGRNFFFTCDRLPSPTPSNDSGDQNGIDIGEEASSLVSAGIQSSHVSSVSEIPAELSASRASSTQISTVSAPISGTSLAATTSGSTPMLKPLAKSRDPRLRFLNLDANAMSKKQSPVTAVTNTNVEPFGGTVTHKMNNWADGPSTEGPSLKKQRNMPQSVVNDKNTATVNGGWLDDIGAIGTQPCTGNRLIRPSDHGRIDSVVTTANVSTVTSVGVHEQLQASVSMPGNILTPVPATSVPSLPEILKSFAVNPTALMRILQMGQLSKYAPDNQSHHDLGKTPMPFASSSSLPGTSAATSTFAQPGALSPSLGVQQSTQQTTIVDEGSKIRMKPRDPRRALHSAFQKPGSEDADNLKPNVASLSQLVNENNKPAIKEESLAGSKPITMQPCILPDIKATFTNSLKNIANIVSVSQGTPFPVLLDSQTKPHSVSVPVERGDVSVSSVTPDKKASAVSPSDLAVAASRQQNGWADVEHLFNGYDDKQKAAIQRERARRMEEQRSMFASRKLCLVLDLDHTLLNSAKFAEVETAHEETLRKKEEQDREKSHRHLFRFPHLGMWTKLRPGIWNFLEKASKLYELHLYTMGNKLYATEMAKVLDPKGVLFSGRVISRGDDGDSFDSDERVPKSKDLEGVLGLESAVVIIDDSVRVWPHNKLNLIVVERYIYFPCSRRQFGLSGPSLLEIDHDERPEDGTLACSLAVIEKIHQNFYNHLSLEEADVRNILASEQRKILGGCRIVFSRIFPVGESNPQLHPLWQTAEQFGAVCTNQIDDQVTHVVALSFGTDKVNWAFSRGKYIVHPGWVEASALLYRRANEQDFIIKP